MKKIIRKGLMVGLICLITVGATFIMNSRIEMLGKGENLRNNNSSIRIK